MSARLDTKVCTACGEEKDRDEFAGKRAAQPCNLCRAEIQRLRAEHQPELVAEYHRRSRLKVRFGISAEVYDEMLRAQDGCCAICREPEKRERDGRVTNLCVDHDHDTGAVRGLLCSDCNRGLGLLRDSAQNLAAAIDYLRGAS